MPSNGGNNNGGSSARKKRKREVTDDMQYVFFRPFDDPFALVHVDRKLLDEWNCKSAVMVRHQAPHDWSSGVPIFNVNTGRAMLIAFLKSLTHNEFYIPKGVSYHEAVRHFEQENICVPGLCDAAVEPKLGAPGILKAESAAYATYTVEEAPAERREAIADMVANAIMEWPRPRIGVTDACTGRDPDYSCTSSRFWVRFAKPPVMEKYGGDEMFNVARKRPSWLAKTLMAIGFVHCELARRGKINAKDRTEAAFTTLAEHIKTIEATRFFISVKRDMPRHHRALNHRVIQQADKWAAWVLGTVVGHGSVHDIIERPSDGPPVHRGPGGEETQYARAAMWLVEHELERTPNCYRMFNGECADDDKKGSTPERKALEKALKARGLKVLRWKDDASQCKDNDRPIKPYVFPPSFLSHLSEDGPCACIEMGPP